MDTEDQSGKLLLPRGVLEGHGNWVTSISLCSRKRNMILTGSRDGKAIVWKIFDNKTQRENKKNPGVIQRTLMGHKQTVSSVVLSTDGNFGLTGSWDSTLRLWDIETGNTLKTFISHTKDVFSVHFSADNKQIISCGRDKTIKIWNILGKVQGSLDHSCHTDWVTCCKFTANSKELTAVSCGYDNDVKLWDARTKTLIKNLEGHKSPVLCLDISPDSSLAVSGGKDRLIVLWDIVRRSLLSTFEAEDEVNTVCFNPLKFWLCAGFGGKIMIWDLESRNVIEDITISPIAHVRVTCMGWSSTGETLYVGATDGKIYVYDI